MPRMDETASFDDVECIHETDEAILCVVDGEKVWFPKTHVHDDSEVYEKGGTGTLVVTEWIAKEKGLI